MNKKTEIDFLFFSLCWLLVLYSRLENRLGNVQLEDSISLLLASLLQQKKHSHTQHKSLPKRALVYRKYRQHSHIHIECMCDVRACVCVCLIHIRFQIWLCMLGSTFELLSNALFWLFNPIFFTNSAFLHFSYISTSGRMNVRRGTRFRWKIIWTNKPLCMPYYSLSEWIKALFIWRAYFGWWLKLCLSKQHIWICMCLNVRVFSVDDYDIVHFMGINTTTIPMRKKNTKNPKEKQRDCRKERKTKEIADNKSSCTVCTCYRTCTFNEFIHNNFVWRVCACVFMLLFLCCIFFSFGFLPAKWPVKT